MPLIVAFTGGEVAWLASVDRNATGRLLMSSLRARQREKCKEIERSRGMRGCQI